MLVSSLEWSLLVAKGAQIDQTPALPTKVKILPSKRLIFLFVDLLIQNFLSFEFIGQHQKSYIFCRNWSYKSGQCRVGGFLSP